MYRKNRHEDALSITAHLIVTISFGFSFCFLFRLLLSFLLAPSQSCRLYALATQPFQFFLGKQYFCLYYRCQKETKFTTVQLLLMRLARFFFCSYHIIKIELSIFITSYKHSRTKNVISLQIALLIINRYSKSVIMLTLLFI